MVVMVVLSGSSGLGVEWCAGDGDVWGCGFGVGLGCVAGLGGWFWGVVGLADDGVCVSVGLLGDAWDQGWGGLSPVGSSRGCGVPGTWAGWLLVVGGGYGGSCRVLGLEIGVGAGLGVVVRWIIRRGGVG